MTNSIGEIEDAGCVFIIGSNTTACHPLIASRVYKAKEKGARLIIADPRRIQLSRFADLAVTHRLGTDVALLNGMMNVILRNGWHAKDYIEKRTEGFDDLTKTVESYTPERVEIITGVPAGDIERMAELYSRNSPAAILYTMGITQHATGVDNVKSCANLAMLCGNVGVPSSGVNPLRGQNNVQGACDMGGLPNVFPGYQAVTDPNINETFSKAWGKDLPKHIGMTIPDMVSAILDGKLKALYVIGENPKMSEPDRIHLDHALKKLDFLLVQDLFLSETAQVADVVFAAASVAEKDGTFTNTERRCLRINKAIEPIGGTLPDWEIICRLSSAMGYPMEYESPEAIFEEVRRLAPRLYGGMTYERLGINGLMWPCPTTDHPGTPYVHKDAFARGKGKFHAIEYLAPVEVPDDEYPFSLTTGRMFCHYHSGTMTRVSPHLDAEQRRGYVDIHPSDAEKIGVKNGDMLLVSSRRGQIEAPARIRDNINPGTVFVPMHFGGRPANVLTSSKAFDPIVKIPEFKVSAVKIEKLQEA
jgi:formate dehydrogenase alpha subunit